MLKNTHIINSTVSFAITVNGTSTAFRIDDAFTCWMYSKGDRLEHNLPNSGWDCARSALSDLVYRALSAGMVVDDTGMKFNVHGHTDGAGFLIRIQRHCQIGRAHV